MPRNKQIKIPDVHIHITKIDWDTDDGNGHKPSAHSLGLPRTVMTDFKTVAHSLPAEDVEEMLDHGVLNQHALNDVLCNWLSDMYGYCVNGFRFDIEPVMVL